MLMTYECFKIEITENIAHLQFSRPEKANSLNLSFWSDFPDAIQKLNSSGEIRALIISGEGKVFCGGLDLNMFAQQPEFHATDAVGREVMMHGLNSMQNALSCLEKTRFPVIAAVHGACVGAGLDLVAACDFCFASEQAKFRIEETNIGMMADIGVLQRLPRQIPLNTARYYALTGDTLTVDDAYRLGLVIKILPDQQQLHEHSFNIAKNIANKPPIAIQGIKRSIIYSRDHSVYESLENTTLLQAAILNGEDILVAIQSRMSGQKADYKNLKVADFAKSN